MKMLVVGANGQFGRAFRQRILVGVNVVAHYIDSLEIIYGQAVMTLFEAKQLALILNSAAHTMVDKAGSEEKLAHAVNAMAVGNLPGAAEAVGACSVMSSPISCSMAPVASLILRIHLPIRHFVSSMLHLMTEQLVVSVVSDQIRTSTDGSVLIDVQRVLFAEELTDVQHYTGSGAPNWYDFVVAIEDEALLVGLLDTAVPVLPISATEYTTPTKRRHYSVLDKICAYAALGAPICV